MSEILHVITVRMTCEAYPAQWEGKTDDNRKIYIRYRWGYLSVCVGEPGDNDEFTGANGNEVFGKQIGNQFHGEMDLPN